MDVPRYFIEKVVRHSSSIERLQAEINEESEDRFPASAIDAVAFDAAEYVWAFLYMSGYENVVKTRELRNEVAAAILGVLKSPSMQQAYLNHPDE